MGDHIWGGKKNKIKKLGVGLGCSGEGRRASERPHVQSHLKVAPKAVWVAFRGRYTFTDSKGFHWFLLKRRSHS